MKHIKIIFASLAVLFVMTSAFTNKTSSSDFQFKSGVTYDQLHLQDRLNWEAVTSICSATDQPIVCGLDLATAVTVGNPPTTGDFTNTLKTNIGLSYSNQTSQDPTKIKMKP